MSRYSALMLVFFFSGFAMRKFGIILSDSEIFEKMATFLVLIGFAIAGFTFWWILSHFDFVEFIGRFSSVSISSLEILKSLILYMITASFFTLSITSVGIFGTDSDSEVISGVSNWFLSNRIILALIFSFFAFYFGVIRSLDFFSDSRYVLLFDWTLISLTVIWSYRSAVNKIVPESPQTPSIPKFERHVQKKEKFTDSNLVGLEGVQKQFVEEGVKEDLVVRLVEIIQESEIRDEAIPTILGDLIYYQDKPVPSLAFGWMKDRVRRKNKRARKNVLEKTMEKINRKKSGKGSMNISLNEEE